MCVMKIEQNIIHIILLNINKEKSNIKEFNYTRNNHIYYAKI